MPRKEILDRIEKYIRPFRITKGEGFQLKNYDPGDTCGLKLDKGEASELLQQGTQWLAEEQDMLTPKIVGRCCSFSRRWMQRARTARSSTSCQA